MAGPFSPFKAPGHVPIIGQPFTVKAFFPTVQIVCNCEAKEPLLIVGSLPAMCSACGRAYTVDEIAFNRKAQTLHVGLGLITAPELAGVSTKES